MKVKLGNLDNVLFKSDKRQIVYAQFFVTVFCNASFSTFTTYNSLSVEKFAHKKLLASPAPKEIISIHKTKTYTKNVFSNPTQ